MKSPIFVRCTLTEHGPIWINIQNVTAMKRNNPPDAPPFTTIFHIDDGDITCVIESPEAILEAVMFAVNHNANVEASFQKPHKHMKPGDPSAN